MIDRIAPVALTMLLPAEAVLLSLRYDTESLDGTFLENASVVPKIAVAIVGTLLVLGGRRLLQAVGTLLGEPHPHRHRSFFIHGLLFACLLAMSEYLFARRLPPVTGSVLWSVLACATGLTWLDLLAPLPRWAIFSKENGRAIGTAIPVGFMAWGAGMATREAFANLNDATFATSRWLLERFYADVVADPETKVLGAPNFRVEIDPACSGYEGIGLICVFLVTFLYVFRNDLRFPRAFWTFPLGILLIWTLNAARITALIIIGEEYSEEIAVQGFHSQAGWLAFNVVSLGVAYLALRVPWFSKNPAEATQPVVNPAAPYLAPFLAAMVATMVERGLTGEFNGLYPLRVFAMTAVLLRFRRHYAGYFSEGLDPGAFVIGTIVFGIWLGLEPSPPPDSLAWTIDLGRFPDVMIGLWLAFRIVGSVALVPICEELAFRGFLLRRLTKRNFETLPLREFSASAWFLSSLIFGILHGRWLAGTIAGIFYALAARRRGQIVDPIVAHATTNLWIAVWVLWLESWSLW